MHTPKAKEREVWLAVRLSVEYEGNDNPVVRGIDWLTDALGKANNRADYVTATSPPFDLTDAAVRALQQMARERAAVSGKLGSTPHPDYPQEESAEDTLPAIHV